jgi:hypothetical protein
VDLKGQGASISQTGLKKRAFETEVAGNEKAEPRGPENLAKNLCGVERQKLGKSAGGASQRSVASVTVWAA